MYSAIWRVINALLGFGNTLGYFPYMISVGTDLLRPIDGVLKNKLNYEFKIELFVCVDVSI